MNLKIKLMPYEKLDKDNFKGLMKDLREKTLILIDAKLSPDEETALIEETMKRIDTGFSGIELSSFDFLEQEKSGFGRIKHAIIEKVVGKKRGMTIIGPAKIVRKIKKNPEEVLLYM